MQRRSNDVYWFANASLTRVLLVYSSILVTEERDGQPEVKQSKPYTYISRITETKSPKQFSAVR